MNPKLASEATHTLDFGEGTKIRVGNTTVTVKGRFYREDSGYIRQIEIDRNDLLKERREINKCIDGTAVEKYAYDAHRPLIDRVTRIAKNLEHERKEKQKLLDMVASRDTTICNLKQNVDFLKKEMRNSIYNMREHLLDKMHALTKSVIDKATVELEKPNVV